jgi:riboflavin biosynthesis pyrimidine reductase
MLEAGGRLTGAFLGCGLIDELVVFMAPVLTCGDVPATAATHLDPRRLHDVSFRRCGDDVMLRALVQPPNICVQRPL